MKRWFLLGAALGLGLAMPQAQAANEFVYRVCVATNGDRTVILPDPALNRTSAEVGFIFDRMSGENIRRQNSLFGKGAGDEWTGPIKRQDIGHKSNTCFRFQIQSKDDGADVGTEWQSEKLSVADAVSSGTNDEGFPTFKRTLRFIVNTPEGRQTFKVVVQTIAAASGQAGFFRLEETNTLDPPEAAPTRKPSANQGALYEADEEDFLIRFGTIPPPLFCLYSEPDYQGTEKCFKKSNTFLPQGGMFKSVRSLRMVRGKEIEFVQPPPDAPDCEDGEECLESGVSPNSFSFSSPKAKTRFNAQGFEVRVKNN